MGLFKKFSDLVRSNINSWLDQAENPQKLAELAISEAEQSKKKAYELLIKSTAALNLGENRLKDLENKNNPAFAQEITTTKTEIAHQQQVINTIKRGLKSLDLYISNLRTQASQLSNELEDNHAFDTFERMKTKIESSELEVEALKELLAEAEQEKAPNISGLEEELEALKKKLGK